MKVVQASEAYLALREERVWKLLAADTAPLVMAMLQSLLLDDDRMLPASVLHERLARDLDLLRARGHALPKTAQAYAADWLAQGWLTRRFPAGASEETYELTADAVNALRYVAGLHKPRAAATESRLAGVMQQVLRLADDTDADPASRLASLQADQERIAREIDALQRDGARTLADERAVERAREIIALAQELAFDFQNVRDAFDRLNRDLRQRLMDSGDGRRGDVLEGLFADVDLIADSEAGRTFAAFWRLLTDGVQSAALAEALDAVVARPFARRLDARERRFLHDLTATLMAEAGGVHDVLQQFARSLKTFVRSREFREQRRLHDLLRQAQQAALAARDRLRPNETIDRALTLASSRIRSVSQWGLYDPDLRLPDASMGETQPSDIGLDVVEALVRRSEIDIRTLEAHVEALLAEVSQASIGDLLARFPAEQGFGSVVGYVALGVRRGEVTQAFEHVRWQGGDGVERSARVPVIWFVRKPSLGAAA